MHSAASLSVRARLACCLLSYALLLPLLLLPPPPRGLTAAAAPPSRAAGTAPAPARADAPRREGELLVRFREGLPEADKGAAVEAKGGRRRRVLRGASRLERVELEPGRDAASVAAELRLAPEVELAEPNYLVARAQVAPDDARFPEQWALRNLGQTGGPTGSDIEAARAWQTSTGSASAVVAVVDSGVDFTHPDLRNNRWANPRERDNGRDDDRDGYADDLHGWDWVEGEGSGAGRDPLGHGTAVAGVMAAEGDNGEGVAGVMWRASVMSLRVLDERGAGDVAAAVEAIDYAASHGAQVVNCSWGTEGESVALREAIERAGRRGVVVVAAAGNAGRDLSAQPYYPASFDLPNVIAVAATDQFDHLAGWSNRGAARVAVAAPGTDILTTRPGGGYTAVSGTSAAAPHVAGIAGLLKAERPWASAGAVRQAILSGARRVSALEGQVTSGGVASAAGALEGALTGPYGEPAGGSDGRGQGGGGRPVRPPTDPPGQGAGRGRSGGPRGTAAPPLKGAPAGLPNLDEIRNQPSHAPGEEPARIQAALVNCSPGSANYPDCDYTVDYGGSDPVSAAPRTEPRNETGQPGVDLGSQNFNWGVPLVPLPGRAGLDLGLSLVYNSLVWTKDGRTMRYNADRGFPTPGFRLGFPTLQPRFYNAQTGRHAYMMITPSGGRVELREGADPFTYEAADGSNVQLTAGGTFFKIVARHSGKGLDVAGASSDNGAAVQQYDYVGGWNQQWRLEPTGGGYYKVVARHGGKSLDVAGVSYDSGAALHQWDYVGGGNQQWRFVPVGGGYYRIEARHSGKAIDVSGGYADNGAQVVQWDWHGGWNQQWQVVPVAEQAVVVRTADGTQYTFEPSVEGELRCVQVKDRNGNYISAAYDASGHLITVTDTLGRRLNFNYDPANPTLLAEIRQEGGTLVRPWARFEYKAVGADVNFADGSGALAVNGPDNGAAVNVLALVRLPDDSRYEFDYTTYGQVYRISHFSQGGDLLTRTTYNLTTGTAYAQPDCPRFSQRRDWVWLGEMNADTELLTTYSVDPNGGWTEVTLPDGRTRQKEYFDTSQAWRRGLTTRSEVSYDGAVKKATALTWGQDDESLAYPQNPRVRETNVSDSDGNRRRTEIEYHPYYAPFNLPWTVTEYAADGQTPLRRTRTDYRMDPAYVERRIIGLVSERKVYDGAWKLEAKTVYQYDTDWGGYLTATAQPAVQHDAANYGVGFRVGRGNLMWEGRFDAEDADNWDKYVSRGYGYNQTGSVTFTDINFGQRTSFDYADSFSDGGAGRGTYAYPTRVTDPAGYAAKTKYVYATGAVAQTVRPSSGTAQAGNLTEEAVEYDYDWAGRPWRVRNLNSGASARTEHLTSGIHVLRYATVEAGAPESYTTEHYDGAGRLRAAASGFPGSAGGYRAVHHMYDKMGRRVQTSNPTEVTAGWAPAGDDAQAGWVWTRQEYDWQGRPTLTTLPDNSTREVSYGGCGCAGSEVTTVRDEANRQRKLYKDALGRLSKVEELTWGGWEVYSATTYRYNTRDQLTEIEQWGQRRTFEYDGHGRLWRRTTPEQGTVEHAYRRDDTPEWARDARGVITRFTFDARRLLTEVKYDLSGAAGQGVAATPDVTFQYDAAGSRTRMAQKVGGVEQDIAVYSYDSLSRLRWEERTFDGRGPYRLSYSYNLAGQLRSVTPEWAPHAAVTYTRDSEGQVTGVAGAGHGGVSAYAHSLQYRAGGAVKSETFGNGRQLTAGYDRRLRLARWEVAGVLGSEYSYDDFGERTGRVTSARNLWGGDSRSPQGAAARDARLDRTYEYDQVGRLFRAYTGSSARARLGLPDGQWVGDGPYARDLVEYDRHGNVTRLEGWGGANAAGTFAYWNNRRDGYGYDASGNLTWDGGQHFSYDATGQQAAASYPGYGLRQWYDGDRLRVKKEEQGAVTYYLRSSVLGGQVVAEIDGGGNWARGYVYQSGGGLLAVQQMGTVVWVHEDPVTKSKRNTDTAGAVTSVVELDPWGGDTGSFSNNRWQQRRMYTSYERDLNHSDEAMHRRYNRWHMRFDQPDPDDGSYDLSDPQSLNRYSYVGNDPVNSVDPTGLFALPRRPVSFGFEAWRDMGHLFDAYRPRPNPEYGFHHGPRNGREPQQPVPQPPPTPTPTPQTPQEPFPFNSCSEFVDFLVEAAVNQSRKVLNDDSKAKILGALMMNVARNEYERHIHNGFAGFKKELTSGGQGAGVYGHILGQGGAKLAGVTTMVIGGLADAIDTAQKWWGTEQGPAEVAGNKAGWAVGRHMHNFLTGKSPREPNRLRNSLMSELCE